MTGLALAAFGLGLALCAPPGVVFAETVRRGLGRGFRAALGVQMGSLVGDGTWAALALGGAALLAQQWLLRLVLGAVGVTLLLYLALKALRDAWRPHAPAERAVVRRVRTQFLQRTQDIAARFGIIHEILDAAEIRHRSPQFLVRDEEIGYFEPGGGYVCPERCISGQLDDAKARGAEIRPGTHVHAIYQVGYHVRIATESGDLLAGHAIVSAGAWARPLPGPLFDRLLKPICQTLHWFAVAAAGVERWRQGLVFSRSHGPDEDGFFYGFPCLAGGDACPTCRRPACRCDGARCAVGDLPLYRDP